MCYNGFIESKHNSKRELIMINYSSRYSKDAFVDYKNVAKRRMLFVDFEYEGGGEPVYRGYALALPKKVRVRFVSERNQRNMRARVKNMRKHKMSIKDGWRLAPASKARTIKRNQPSRPKSNL